MVSVVFATGTSLLCEPVLLSLLLDKSSCGDQCRFLEVVRMIIFPIFSVLGLLWKSTIITSKLRVPSAFFFFS